jgi:hypothetical protein
MLSTSWRRNGLVRSITFPFRATKALQNLFERLEDSQRAGLAYLRRINQRLSELDAQPDPVAEKFRRLVPDKRAFVDYACVELGIRSIADLGGALCDPPGGYSFYAMEKYLVPAVYLADQHIPEELAVGANNHPGFHLIRGSAGSEVVSEQIPVVDAIFLFDILIHCVKPDWDQLLEKYAGRTTWFFVSNIMYMDFDRTVRLIDLGEEEYFDCVPSFHRNQAPWTDLFPKLDEPYPDDPSRTYRDCMNFYQWGITDNDLIGTMRRLGFDLYYLKTMFERREIKKNAWSRLFAFRKRASAGGKAGSPEMQPRSPDRQAI